MTLDTQPRLADLTLRPIVTIGPDEAFRTAAQVMRTGNVSSVVVNQPTKPVAIITERDITRAVAEGRDPATAVIGLASPNPLTIPTDTTAVDAATRMLREGIRHLVVTRGDRAVGIVSVRDILGALVQALTPDAVYLMIRQAWCDLPDNWLG